MSLREIEKDIENCRRCELWKEARYAVPGKGPLDAKVMLIGQNPGKKEDQMGKPFVGQAGKYLNKILEENEIDREKLFITSIVKHKTPKNRPPTEPEIGACLIHLIRQIKEIGPTVIVLMGKTSWETPRYEGIRYIETYHPAAAMRFPKINSKFVEDIRNIRDELD